MREHFNYFIRNLSLNPTDRDMSLNEVRVYYVKLHEQIDQLFNDIKIAVDKNDYVKLIILANRRKRLNEEIDAIESIFDEDDIRTSSYNRIIGIIQKAFRSIRRE